MKKLFEVFEVEAEGRRLLLLIRKKKLKST